jgi:hypothetical protein
MMHARMMRCSGVEPKELTFSRRDEATRGLTRSIDFERRAQKQLEDEANPARTTIRCGSLLVLYATHIDGASCNNTPADVDGMRSR